MTIKTLNNLNYQRNGVCGNPFYSCIITVVENEGTFLATFELNNQIFNLYSCRIVQLENPMGKWRGDEFGYDLIHYFNDATTKKNIGSIFELIAPDDPINEHELASIQPTIDLFKEFEE